MKNINSSPNINFCPIKVAIVDDHGLMVEGLRRMINDSGRALITASYEKLQQCRDGLDQSRPDVLLLDIDLPDGYGDDFCKEILVKYPDLKIMIITGFDELNIARRALKNGALGYALKNSDSDEILLGIETVAEGKQFLCEKIDIKMRKSRFDEQIFISNREREMLKYLVKGLTSNEIGENMHVCNDTVKGYRKNLMLKLGAKNVADLIFKALEQKLVPKDSAV
jgi:DNA-binding NarL/FixJ family response regulator